jgi:threonine dehydrogenase-like Zn-dependent dehydrogenase
MKGLSVIPGNAGSAEMIDLPAPAPLSDGALLVRPRIIGICATDAEIIAGDYGEAPPGEQRLILGHESLGEVVEAPAGSGFVPGQLVVGVVRRPDPEPCDHCAREEWDMCRNGLFTECGIKQRHGYAQELYSLEPEYAIPVDPSLGDLGVLVEPASVVGKASAICLHFLKRTQVPPRTALITGAGPIGLLAALATTQYGLDTYVVDIVETGLKPDLVRKLGATYHTAMSATWRSLPEVVIECTGVGAVCAAGVSPRRALSLPHRHISGSAAAEVDLNVF